MVYTRTQFASAAKSARTASESTRTARTTVTRRDIDASLALLKLTTSILTPVARFTASRPATAPVASSTPRFTTAPRRKPVANTRLWANWSSWYEAFVEEVRDERTLTGAARFAEAETRWATFCAKSLKCHTNEVYTWLTNTDRKARMKAVGL